MSRIATLHINNFKFFDKQPPIKLDGRHLLLFGENGSGKSSIYWALYTLFEAAIKDDDEDIKKYFRRGPGEEQSLANIYADKVTDTIEHYDSYIEVITTDNPSKKYILFLLRIKEFEETRRQSKLTRPLILSIIKYFSDSRIFGTANR